MKLLGLIDNQTYPLYCAPYSNKNNKKKENEKRQRDFKYSFLIDFLLGS